MKIKYWLAMAICCIPPMAFVILGILGIGLGSTFGLLSTRSAEIGVALAVMMGIACPTIMGLMMWLMLKNRQPSQQGLPAGMREQNDERNRETVIT